MKAFKLFLLELLMLLMLGSVTVCQAIETGMFRLLSISESEKLILVSRIPDKKKLLMDVKAAKITVDGEPAEIEELQSFTSIQVQWKESDEKRNGVRLDGTVLEIEVTTPESPEKDQTQ